jgi:hypothetical protein
VQRNSLIRMALSAVVVVALGVTLSGCVGTVGGLIVSAAKSTRAGIAAKDKPHRGECWQATFKDVDGYANWGDGHPAVSCTLPHQLYTFGVANLAGKYKGKLFDSKGYISDALEADATQSCTNYENTELNSVDETVARIYLLQILPEEQQWDAGARWVRCDVGVLAVGSSPAHPSFESLPDSEALYTQLRDSPAQFDFCVNDVGGTGPGGPKGKNAVYADCLQNPQWKLEGYASVVTGTGKAYPTPAQFEAQDQLSCVSPYADATHITYAYNPTPSDWKSNDKQLECWVGQK